MEKTYLKWYNKVGYGSGDIAGNVIYALLSSFVMIYLTDSAGMDAGIVGTLMLASKVFDGVTDIFFGSMIDKTHTKMGKARPWMFFGFFGCAVTLAAVFAIPAGMSETAKYAWFFISYTLLNAVFYTANNIAYSALTALITKNQSERVQMGSIRFMFAFGTSMLIQAVTVRVVQALGGGAAGWRTTAIIYAIIGVIFNSLSVLSVKELPPEELAEGENQDAPEEKYSLVETMKILCKNKYYLLICGVYILSQFYTATLNMGIYFMTYILGDATLLGTFSLAINIPMIAGLILTPMLVKKMNGMYKLNLTGYALGTIARALVMFSAYMGSVPLMLLFSGVAALGMSPLQGDLNALIATCSKYTYLTQHKQLDGTMYSCTSLGVKIGGGIGVAVAGWLLKASGYVANLPTQSQSCINMLYFMYLWMPMLMNLVITFLLSRLKVEEANAKLVNG
ncbi:MAG: glycoside-pentoside-hexuronide (GPH):cation symporter [Oscillospiraceae bacterium]|nr:glycoside-pentoside-hexuronide (GPH):cation symporter [Oscillospiraceae bacterium]